MKNIILILLVLFCLSCSKKEDIADLCTLSNRIYRSQNEAHIFLDTICWQSFDSQKRVFIGLLQIQAKDFTDYDITNEFSNVKKAIAFCKKQKEREPFLKLAYYYAGRICMEKNKCMDAIRFFHLATEVKDHKINLDSRIYSQLGDLYYEQYLYDYAIQMYDRAYEAACKEHDTVIMAQSFRDKALVFLEQHKYTLALALIRHAQKIAEKTNDTRCKNSIKSYLILAYAEQGNYREAKALLPSLLNNIDKSDSCAYYFIAARIYKHINKEKAKSYYRFLEEKGNLYAKEDAYSFFAQEAFENKNTQVGLVNFSKYQNTVDLIRSSTNSEMLAKIKGLYDYHNKEAEIARLSTKESKLYLEILGISSALLFVIIMGSFAIVRLKKKAKEERQHLLILKKLQEEQQLASKEQMAKNNRKIYFLEKELQNSQIIQEKIRKKLTEEREKLVAQNVMSQIKKKERDEAVEQIRKSAIGLRIHSIATSDVKTHLTQDEKRKLEEEFDQQMPSFKEKLWSIIDLNNRELCVCLLFKLGYKPADIAHLLGCTPSAISKIKVRQYKKIFGTDGRAEDWDAFMKEM